MNKAPPALSLMVALLLSSPSGYANNNDQAKGERRGPPPEAFTVCEGKSSGDTAQLETRNGKTLAGICEELGGMNAGKLVLRPNRKGQDGKRRTPPQEAFAACTDKDEGDTSQFENRKGKILKGTCENANGQLVLRPERFNK